VRHGESEVRLETTSITRALEKRGQEKGSYQSADVEHGLAASDFVPVQFTYVESTMMGELVRQVFRTRGCPESLVDDLIGKGTLLNEPCTSKLQNGGLEGSMFQSRHTEERSWGPNECGHMIF
jgi:hypothetical protein